jgi:hypothetical protein
MSPGQCVVLLFYGFSRSLRSSMRRTFCRHERPTQTYATTTRTFGLLQADSFNAFQNAWLITRKFSAGREMAMSHTALIFIVLFMLQSLLPPTGKVEATASPSAREPGENQMVSDAEKDTTDKKPGRPPHRTWSTRPQDLCPRIRCARSSQARPCAATRMEPSPMFPIQTRRDSDAWCCSSLQFLSTRRGTRRRQRRLARISHTDE